MRGIARVRRLQTLGMGESGPTPLQQIISAYKQLPGSVAIWTMENNSPLLDRSGNDHSLPQSGAPTFGLTTGGGPYADKVATDYWSANDDAWNSITGPLFICGWVKHDAVASAVEYYFSKWLSAGDQRCYLFWRDAAGKLQMLVTSSGTAASQVGTNSDAATIGTGWTFVAMRFVPSTSMDVFIDGVKGITNVTGIPASIFNGSSPLQLGTVNAGGGAGCNALMGTWGLYNAAPSDAEVLALYNTTKGFFLDDVGFTVVWLPDTQLYSKTYPATFTAQTNWIAANKTALNIQAVLHAGDLVDSAHGASGPEWLAAHNSMTVIDVAEIPYLCAAGNHDYDDQGVTRALVDYNATFGQTRYSGHGWWAGGFFEAAHSENSYMIVTILGQAYLFLCLEYGPRQAVIDWANALLTTHAAKKVILFTHSYMYDVGDVRTGAGAINNPHEAFGNVDVHDGDEMYAELVSQHDNVVLVISGHHVETGLGHRTDTSPGGQIINQVCCDYQILPNGGNGYLRVMTFYPGVHKIDNRTYSPTLNLWKVDAANKWVMSY